MHHSVKQADGADGIDTLKNLQAGGLSVILNVMSIDSTVTHGVTPGARKAHNQTGGNQADQQIRPAVTDVGMGYAFGRYHRCDHSNVGHRLKQQPVKQP
jgi:hypothetical protein